MSIVKRENIPQLHSTDPAFFARWLIGGLETLHTTGQGFVGFRGATAFVGATADTSEELRDIHDCLNPDERAAFRAGVARALGCTVHLLTDPAAIGICNTLLVLAQRLEADDVLDVLPGFASHVLSLPQTEPIDEMMDRVLRTASEATTPGPRAADCLRTIISLGRFQPTLAYPALIALCKAEPGNLGDHLIRLHRSLDKAFGYVEDRDELERRVAERRELIAEVFDIVSHDEFFRASDDMTISSQQDDLSTIWGLFANWWRNDIFLVRAVAERYSELRNDRRSSSEDKGEYERRATTDEREQPAAAGAYAMSIHARIGVRAAEARQAMPGIDRVPDSVEEAQYPPMPRAA